MCSHLIYSLIPLDLNLITSEHIHFMCSTETVYIMYPHTISVFPQQPEECEPVKRLTRSAAKSASGKIKVSWLSVLV